MGRCENLFACGAESARSVRLRWVQVAWREKAALKKGRCQAGGEGGAFGAPAPLFGAGASHTLLRLREMSPQSRVEAGVLLVAGPRSRWQVKILGLGLACRVGGVTVRPARRCQESRTAGASWGRCRRSPFFTGGALLG